MQSHFYNLINILIVETEALFWVHFSGNGICLILTKKEWEEEGEHRVVTLFCSKVYVVSLSWSFRMMSFYSSLIICLVNIE